MQNEEWDGDAEWRDPRFGSGGRWSESTISWLQTKAVSPLRSATAVQIRAGLTSATGHWDVAGAPVFTDIHPYSPVFTEIHPIRRKKLPRNTRTGPEPVSTDINPFKPI